MFEPLVLRTDHGDLDGGYQLPAGEARALLVLAHGAGAGFEHKNMAAIAGAFAEEGIASLRFNFPFMQQGKRRVDAQPVALAAIGAAIERARTDHPRLPLVVGGHSFGGRMASHWLADAAAGEGAGGPAGAIFMSFPLHTAGKPAVKRAAHLPRIRVPMLFLSGTRDDLADPELLEATVSALPLAHLHWLDTANHGYAVLKRTRRPELGSVFSEMAARAARFVNDL